MKSAVETLNPTRVRLRVEVPFEELQPSLDAAYKKIAAQVSIPGFRRGKVPARLIDQRFGRGVVLEEAVNDALPQFYGRAVQESGVQVLGQPEVDVTDFADGESLAFTAEVDVRPEFELPDYQGLEVVVDDAEVTDAEVDEQVQSLRERFGVLRGVDRPAQDGDFLSLDLSASVDGEPIEEATASGLSYQIGSGSLLDGLDEAVTGRSAGETGTFATTLVGGEYAGREAQVQVQVQSVKERDLPELDDDFAQLASEFDTLDELRADVRTRLDRVKRLEQGAQARDRVLEALLVRVDVPLPESVVQGEVEARQHQLTSQLEAAGLSKEAYLRSEEQSQEEFDAEVAERAREAIKAQFVLDKVAEGAQLGVEEGELSAHLVRRASQAGMSPDQFAQQLVEAGQVPLLVSEVVRGKALATVLEAASVRDASGRTVDLEALRADATAAFADIEADELAHDELTDDELTDDELTDDELTDDELADDELADDGADELAADGAEADETGSLPVEGTATGSAEPRSAPQQAAQ